MTQSKTTALHFPDLHYWHAGVLQQGEVWLSAEGLISESKVPDAITQSCERGDWLVPGLVDLHANLREPGAVNKASIKSELRAAIAAGVTSVLCSPDTQPCIDSTAVVELIHDRARHASSDAPAARLFPLCALTKGLSEEKLAELATLKHAGCIAASNADKAISNSGLLQRALLYAASVDVAVHLHPIDRYLSIDGVAHDGRVAARLGLAGIPELAETLALARDLMLIEATSVRAHISRISCAESVRMMASAKARGLQITCDVAIANLFLCDNDVLGFRANMHVRPPLRTSEDRDALRAGLANGTIDAICSNHAPHDLDAKLAPFPMTEPGASSIDALLPLSLQLVEERVLSAARWLEVVSLAPKNIAGIRVNDWVLIKPNARTRMEADALKSRGKNSPFLGWEMMGRVSGAWLFEP